MINLGRWMLKPVQQGSARRAIKSSCLNFIMAPSSIQAGLLSELFSNMAQKIPEAKISGFALVILSCNSPWLNCPILSLGVQIIYSSKCTVLPSYTKLSHIEEEKNWFGCYVFARSHTSSKSLDMGSSDTVIWPKIHLESESLLPQMSVY